MIIEINDENFDQEIINSDIPVFIDFWADWCNPCRMVAPIIKELSEEYNGKVKICKAKLDDNSKAIQKFEIQSLPTFLSLKDDKVIKKEVGIRQKKDLQDMIEEIMEK